MARILLIGDSLSLLWALTQQEVNLGKVCTYGRPSAAPPPGHTPWPSPGRLLALRFEADGHEVTVAACGGYAYSYIDSGKFVLPPEDDFDSVIFFLGTNDASSLAVGGGISKAGMRKAKEHYHGKKGLVLGPPSFPSSHTFCTKSVPGADGKRKCVESVTRDINKFTPAVYAALEDVFPGGVIDTRPMTADLTGPSSRGDGIHFSPAAAQQFADAIYEHITGEGHLDEEEESRSVGEILERAIPSSIRDSFVAKAHDICDRTGLNYDYLMASLFAESGFNPRAVNKDYVDKRGVLHKGSGATGLIQWLPAYAKGDVGYTTDEILNMDALRQLDLVELHFQKILKSHRLDTLEDTYQAIYSPAYIGKPEVWRAIPYNLEAQQRVASIYADPAGWLARMGMGGMYRPKGSARRSAGAAGGAGLLLLALPLLALLARRGR